MSDISDTIATRATRMQHERDTSNTSATRVRYKCYTNDTSTTQVLHNETSVTQLRNFAFDNDTSKNIFSYHYIYYMASERLQEEEQFHSKN